MKKFPALILFLGISLSCFSAVNRENPQVKESKKNPVLNELQKRFATTYKKDQKLAFKALKMDVLKAGGTSVPVLVEVMKSTSYPDKNRWMATFLLGKIMGKKASPFISKFLQHPNWVMRMASLKTLLALKDTSYDKHFAAALRDNSLLVRKQALVNITRLDLKNMAPHVWAMLYDKKNYHTKNKAKKGTYLVKNVIRSVGDLKFKKALTPLFKMIQKDKYQDLFKDIEYSLAMLTGKKVIKGTKSIKRNYWKSVAISYKAI